LENAFFDIDGVGSAIHELSIETFSIWSLFYLSVASLSAYFLGNQEGGGAMLLPEVNDLTF